MGRDIILAISVFRSDPKVIKLLEAIFVKNKPAYLEIILVDSLPTGELEEYIKSNSLPIQYITSETNLGSAGNLALRLQLAAKNIEANWCFCLNHDAYYSSDFAQNFIEETLKLPSNTGAVFPTRKYDNGSHIHTKKSIKETWDSSNGCIYSLNPIRNGLSVDERLWMGWEDYFYCVTLLDNGYSNFKVNSLPFYDPYEYRSFGFSKLQIKLNDKPAWYDYYSVRNLIYISKHRPMGKLFFSLFIKVVINSMFLSILKDNKRKRISLFFKGVKDGVIGRMGFRGIF